MSRDPLGRLMLVEDEHVLRDLVQQFLTLEGYQVEAAPDGREAIATYEREGPFDLVLLDLNLPYISGVEACRQIKRMNPHQPVLICSAAILESHTEALQALDVVDTLGKPYHPAELTSRIRIIMARAAGDPVGHVSPRRIWRSDDAAQGEARPSALSEARIME